MSPKLLSFSHVIPCFQPMLIMRNYLFVMIFPYTCLVMKLSNFPQLLNPKCWTLVLSNAWFAIMLLWYLMRRPPELSQLLEIVALAILRIFLRFAHWPSTYFILFFWFWCVWWCANEKTNHDGWCVHIPCTQFLFVEFRVYWFPLDNVNLRWTWVDKKSSWEHFPWELWLRPTSIPFSMFCIEQIEHLLFSLLCLHPRWRW